MSQNDSDVGCYVRGNYPQTQDEIERTLKIVEEALFSGFCATTMLPQHRDELIPK
jgi:hypothetical protein